VKSLVSGQRAVLRDIWPKIGGQLSEFERGEYTKKRLAVFEADEAKLLEDLRNYSQHKSLPYLNPAWQFSQSMPMAEFQFRLRVEPLLSWDSLTAEVRNYLEEHDDSIDLIPIIAGVLDAPSVFGRGGAIRELGQIMLPSLLHSVRGSHAVACMSPEFRGQPPSERDGV
jgi:hypothetical protein